MITMAFSTRSNFMLMRKPDNIVKAAKKRLGFTLIELLVVIAIIALLVSILLPSLKTAKELAIRATCGSQLRGVGSALGMYTYDNNGLFPSSKGPQDQYGWSGSIAYWWLSAIGSGGVTAISPYVSSKQMFCPASLSYDYHKYYEALWNDPVNGGDIGYFAYCGRVESNGIAFLVDSPMESENCMPTDLTMGDFTSDVLIGEFNNHGTEEGGNWLTADSAVNWISRPELTEIYSSPTGRELVFPKFR